MKSSELRQRFLEFFAERGHQVVPSSSLIPVDNPTLLFTVAGMVQFNDVFLGREQRPYSRAASSQKCLRISGKQNDLENVGPSPRHHTFFEMLGNFSFGDYFKREAIQFAWDFLVGQLKLDPQRLWVTIYEGDEQIPADEEAEDYWQQVGVPKERILRFGPKDNLWAAGDTGPRGPCSEIHYYQGDQPESQTPAGVNSDDDNYMEIWNLVFMQYNRDEDGTLTPLPKPSIDTGMSLERLAAVVQGVRNNYATDAFTPIIHTTMELLGANADHYAAHAAAYHVVADHSRAVAFMIADGLRPGNEGRSYVLRRLIRRAAYFGQTIGFNQPFLAETVTTVINTMSAAYPELSAKADYIAEVVTAEEERFSKTLASGLKQLEAMLSTPGSANGTVFSGAEAFKLYDTYGFPLDLTAKILAERGLVVDEAEYERELEAQRARGRDAAQFKKGAAAERWAERDLPATAFVGYHELQTWAHVLALEVDNEELGTVQRGQQVQLVLDRTPCYAESGGQVGDTGTLRGPNGVIKITDVQKPLPGLFIHFGEVVEGAVSLRDQVEVVVDAERRRAILRNHTATHLLHRALRDVLGEHAEQAGSLVAPDRLRFDFTNQRPVSAEQLHTIEQSVNSWILADTQVSAAEMTYPEAINLGAMALFGEKYGDVVRVITIGCGNTSAAAELGDVHVHAQTGVCSRELCGGTHVQRTGEIGFFRIVSEGSVAAGVRRIEALTGHGAIEWVANQTSTLDTIADKLAAQPAQIVERVDALLAELKQRKQEIDRLRSQIAAGLVDQLVQQKIEHKGTTIITARVEAPDADAFRQLSEQLRDRIGAGIVVLGTVIDEKPLLLVALTPDQIKAGRHAGKLVKSLATLIGGGGGGRPDFAQAGGRDASGLDQALSRVTELLDS